MDLQTRKSEFRDAWNAFGAADKVEGWRTILVTSVGEYPARAGKRFPSGEESVLVYFPNLKDVHSSTFPVGRGFEVTRADLGEEIGGDSWIALIKKPNADPELFLEMAADIANVVEQYRGKPSGHAYEAFLNRISAWQDFMHRDRNAKLSQEEQLGLWGEIQFLLKVISLGQHPVTALDSWCGPLDSAKDFSFPTGSVEIKVSALRHSFIAKISSLHQLDSDSEGPLFLQVYQVIPDQEGTSLVELINSLREAFISEDIDPGRLDYKLLRAGFLASQAVHYEQKLTILQSPAFMVDSDFPRITRSNQPASVVSATYELDIGSLNHLQKYLPTEIATAVGAVV